VNAGSGNVKEIVNPATQNPKAIEAYAMTPVVTSLIFGETTNRCGPNLTKAVTIIKEIRVS
jgi:hypothetical protein